MTKLRLKPGYLVQQIGNEKVLIPCGIGSEVDFSKMVVLNEVGAFIVENMQGTFIAKEHLVELLMVSYDADYTCVKRDVEDFLNEMEEQGLLQKEY
ncbi:PqqD family protein [Phocaeicola sp.]